MQITLIRHLPTEWNKKTWLQGRRDIEITDVTEDFHQKIVKNKRTLERLKPFDGVFASTLRRTHQTAHLYGLVPETESLLDELDFGPFEGLPKKILLQEFGEKWVENPIDIMLGESIQNLEKRVVLFLKKYRNFKNILVFGHGSWLRAMVSYQRFGHINRLNKISIENNECITLKI